MSDTTHDDLVKRLRSKIIVHTDVAVWILEAASRIEELEAKLAQQGTDWDEMVNAMSQQEDLVQAAVAAALREAAQAARLSISERDEWPPKDGDVLIDDCMAAILAIRKGGE